jgi:hypothetical protein
MMTFRSRRFAWLFACALVPAAAARAASPAPDLCTALHEVAELGRQATLEAQHPDPFATYQGARVGGDESKRFRSLKSLPGSALCAVVSSWSADQQRTLTCTWTGFASASDATREATSLYEQVTGCFPGREWNQMKVSRAINWVWLSAKGKTKVMFVVSTEEDSPGGLCALFYDEHLRDGGCPLLPQPLPSADAMFQKGPVVQLEVTVYGKDQ